VKRAAAAQAVWEQIKSFLNIKAWTHVTVEAEHTNMNLKMSIMGPF